MIAITGQIGGIALSFAHAARRAGLSVTALARNTEPTSAVDRWRLGSLASQNDLRQMLADVDCVFYFCFTPPANRKTNEGHAFDVAIYDAMNFAHVASRMPNLHVVLATRLFPHDDRPLSPEYTLWKEVSQIFDENIPWLTQVHSAPLWSEYDAVTLGMLAFAQHRAVPQNDVRFYNLCSPAPLHALTRTLLDCAGETHNLQHEVKIVEGSCAVSYSALIQCIKNELARKHVHRVMASVLRNEFSLSLQFEDLFRHSVLFHTSSENNIHRAGPPGDARKIFEQCRDFVLDQQDVSVFDALTSRISTAARKSKNSVEMRFARPNSHIYRIARNPRRSVHDISTLFVQWIPRHFYRLVRMDDLGNGRQICKIANIPLFEVETADDSWQRATIAFRSPWASIAEPSNHVVLSITGTRENPREILLVVEDSSQKIASIAISESVIRKFGQYLRDYGVAE